MRKYHHVGVPTDIQRDGEYHIEGLKVHVVPFDSNPYGIEWMRYEAGCPVPELVQKVPHVAFEVDEALSCRQLQPSILALANATFFLKVNYH